MSADWNWLMRQIAQTRVGESIVLQLPRGKGLGRYSVTIRVSKERALRSDDGVRRW